MKLMAHTMFTLCRLTVRMGWDTCKRWVAFCCSLGMSIIPGKQYKANGCAIVNIHTRIYIYIYDPYMCFYAQNLPTGMQISASTSHLRKSRLVRCW